MSTRGSWITLKFRGVVDVVRASRYQSSYGGLHRNSPLMSAARIESGSAMHPSLQFFSTKNNTRINANRLKNDNVQPPEAPASRIFTFPSWLKWVLGTLLSMVLPFWKYNWQKLQRIEGEAEVVVEVVEKVATVAEKVSEDVEEMLGEDSKLKKAVLVIENASKQAAHDAQLAQDFIHKVEQVTNDVEDLESFVEPVIDKIMKKRPQKNN